MPAGRRRRGSSGSKHDREFEEIEPPHPNETAGARLRRKIASMPKGVLALPQDRQLEAGRQVRQLQAGCSGGHIRAIPEEREFDIPV